MGEYEILFLTIMVASVLMVAIGVALHWSAESARRARIAEINRNSPLGQLSERMAKAMTPEIIRSIEQGNDILRDLPYNPANLRQPMHPDLRAVRFGGRYDLKTSKDSHEERSRLGGASHEPTAKGD